MPLNIIFLDAFIQELNEAASPVLSVFKQLVELSKFIEDHNNVRFDCDCDFVCMYACAVCLCLGECENEDST